ncbi:DUF3850 domain-containing protein [Megamonas hypermegale]|uniref:DUF3850 domain-containing protein n=1 Tax=Megamonas hypermegale TaxID=158847 RepID=UPI00242CF632|nr:DUF3850 domain-containing protein [Megamonas hypermegale]
MVHTLKIKPKYFNDVLVGKKNFEVRLNDRNYQEGDEVILKEFNDGIYTGKSIRAVITYLLKHNDFPVGIPKDYVVFSIEIIKQN